jgi:hypothetical protein
MLDWIYESLSFLMDNFMLHCQGAPLAGALRCFSQNRKRAQKPLILYTLKYYPLYYNPGMFFFFLMVGPYTYSNFQLYIYPILCNYIYFSTFSIIFYNFYICKVYTQLEYTMIRIT